MLRRLGAATGVAAAAAAAAAAACERTVAPPPETRSVALRDGRLLAFQTWGDPEGVPVVALHGMGSSHRTWATERPLSSLVRGVLLIAVDRPGYGDSSPPPAAYSYTQAADDVAQLADALHISQFCVAGHSSGGPYALACAALMPSRVLACAAISSDPPYTHPRAPAAVRESDSMSNDVQAKGFYGADPLAKVAKWRASDLAKGRPEKLHAWKQGCTGWVIDFTLERIPWSFRVEDITPGEHTSFWYGTHDFDAMRVGSPWMASLVPGSRLIEVEGNHGFKSDPQHLAAILTELRDQALSAPSS